jgi:hypothetical protein
LACSRPDPMTVGSKMPRPGLARWDRSAREKY